MTKYLRVVADTNDADYISTFKIIPEKHLKMLAPLIRAIKNFTPYTTKIPGEFTEKWRHENNFTTGECTREDLGEKSAEELYVKSGLVTQEVFDLFDESYCPHCEFGIHTIESIDIVEVSKITKLL